MSANKPSGGAVRSGRGGYSSDRLQTLRAIVLALRGLFEGNESDSSVGGPHPSREGRSEAPGGDLWRQLRTVRLGGDRTVGGSGLGARASDGTRAPTAESERELVAESALCWANRLLALRCLEARGLVDEVIVRRAVYGGRSLRHHRLIQQAPELCAGEDDGLYAALEAASAELSTALPSLFGPSEAAALLRPSVFALDRAIGLLSGEWSPRGLEPSDDELFRDPTALAWSYQFWNAERKERIFDRLRRQRGQRLAGDDLSAATQLYTEPYLVRFVLHNTLGALWAAWHPSSRLLDSWPMLVRQRAAASPPPRPLRELAVLDPACGSGHFLLEAFDMLFAMYEEEGAIDDPREIARTIIGENLIGMDVDARAIQITEALLWMRAAERAPGLSPVRPNLLSLDSSFSHWAAHLRAVVAADADCAPLAERLRLLDHAHELGSLLTLELPADVLDPLQAACARVGARDDPGPQRRGFETLRRLVDLSARRYDVIATNPPYAGFRLLAPHVKQEVLGLVPEASLDIYVAFIAHFSRRLTPHGRLGVVCPASWTTSSHTRALRQRILDDGGPALVAALGQGVFDTAPLLFVCLAVVERAEPGGAGELVTLRPAPRSGADGLYAACGRGGERWSWTLLRELDGVPFLPAAPPALLERARDAPTVGELFTLTDGVWSGSSDRDVREGWELPRGTPGWELASGGQGYCRWYAATRRRHRRPDGAPQTARRARIDHAPLEYARVAGGKLAARFVSTGAAPPSHDPASGPVASPIAIAGIVRLAPRPNAEPSRVEQLAAIFNTRVGQLWLRTLASGLNFNPGYAARVPLGVALPPPALVDAVGRARGMKQQLARWDPISDDFEPKLLQPVGGATAIDLSTHLSRCVCARLELVASVLEVESEIEALLAVHLELPDEVLAAIDQQLGLPVARFPGVPAPVAADPLPEGEGSDAQPLTEPYPADSPLEALARAWSVHPRAIVDAMRATGPPLDADREPGSAPDRPDQGSDDAAQGDTPLGTELTAAARALFAKEATRLLGDYLTLVVLHLQLAKESGQGSPDERDQPLAMDSGQGSPDERDQPLAADPWAAVGDAWSADGIVMVTPTASHPGAAALVCAQLASAFPTSSPARIERQAQRLLGRPVAEWLERELCPWHAKRLFRRPVLWQLQSCGRRGRPAFCCWVHAHRVDHDTLPKIVSQYLPALTRAARTELAALPPSRPASAQPSRRAAALESRVAELASFADRVRSVMATGFQAAAPEPSGGYADVRYAPDLADGVRVNLAPLQQGGLLAHDVLDPSQVDRAITDRLRWRAEVSARHPPNKTTPGRPPDDHDGGES